MLCIFYSFFAAVMVINANGHELDCSHSVPRDHFYYENLNHTFRPAERYCNVHGPPSQFVSGGTVTKHREFPYMCAIGWRSADNEDTLDFKCGGVLINPKYILTAAHCIYVNGVTPVVILPGGPNLTDSREKLRRISKVTLHPNYDPDSVYNDIALIQTFERIHEFQACLWTSYELERNDVTIIGYGDTRYAGSSSLQLLKADLQAVSNKECERFYEPDFSMSHGIIAKQLCARDPEHYRDACQGDSGGPLIMKKCLNKKPISFVVGITSFGYGCAGEPPGVYTRISEYLDWIEKIVWPKEKLLKFQFD